MAMIPSERIFSSTNSIVPNDRLQNQGRLAHLRRPFSDRHYSSNSESPCSPSSVSTEPGYKTTLSSAHAKWSNRHNPEITLEEAGANIEAMNPNQQSIRPSAMKVRTSTALRSDVSSKITKYDPLLHCWVQVRRRSDAQDPNGVASYLAERKAKKIGTHRVDFQPTEGLVASSSGAKEQRSILFQIGDPGNSHEKLAKSRPNSGDLQWYILKGTSGRDIHHAVLNQRPDNYAIANNALNLTISYVDSERPLGRNGRPASAEISQSYTPGAEELSPRASNRNASSREFKGALNHDFIPVPTGYVVPSNKNAHYSIWTGSSGGPTGSRILPIKSP